MSVKMIDMETTKTYEIKTQSDTRSKTRQNMTHSITAETESDAIYEARRAHIDRVGWNSSVWIVTTKEV